jgi:hypothetical protein
MFSLVSFTLLFVLDLWLGSLSLQQHKCSSQHKQNGYNLRAIERAAKQCAAAFGVAPQFCEEDSHACAE